MNHAPAPTERRDANQPAPVREDAGAGAVYAAGLERRRTDRRRNVGRRATDRDDTIARLERQCAFLRSLVNVLWFDADTETLKRAHDVLAKGRN